MSGSYAYREWVQYWRKILERPERADRALGDVPAGDNRVIEHLIGTSGRDFYLERGGTILLDAEAKSPRATLDDLFARLVREADPPAPPTLQEKSRDALIAAGAPVDDDARFKEQFEIAVHIQGVSIREEISYAVMNGEWHYLQVMPFAPDRPRVTRKEASHCAFLFEHVPEMSDNGALLYDAADITEGQYRYLEMLMKLGPVVDVSDVDRAAERLHDRLGLDEVQGT